MKTLLRLSALVLPFALAGSLAAQTAPADNSGPRRGPGGPGGPGGHGGPRGNPIVRVLDTDRNHELSAAEIANVAVVAAALTTGPGLPGAAELARAIWLEKTKTGLTFARSDLGPLTPHLTEDPEDAD